MKKILFGALALVLACFLFATPKTTVSAAQLEYNVKVVSCDQSDSGILNEPTVITELKKKEDVNAILQARKKPSNVIVNFDENENIVDDNGGVISDFYSLHKSELGQKVIFVVRLESDGATNAFLKMLTETYRPLDIAVLSTNPEFVKRIKSSTAGSHVRGAVEFAEGTPVAQIVRTTQESQAIMAIIPQSMASTQTVRYIHARFKTVWVRVSSDKGVDLYDCINSGTYGIITQDYQKAYDTLATYTQGLTRTPFNVAHRGIPTAYNENSISGTVAAIENGATHVELDAYLTTDRQIVMMHDNTLDRTSNGTGNIESKTLAEIKQYKLDLYGKEDIPTFDDIAKVIKDTGVVWVFEIKSGNTEIVKVLKEKIYEFELQDQLVVISFNLNILSTMKSILPEIPTANLNTANQATFHNVLATMGTYNAVIDTAYANADAAFNEVLRDHGIVGWYWTFSYFGEGTKKGYVGQTNNKANVAKGEAMYDIGLAPEYKNTSVEVGDIVDVLFVTYDGAEKVVPCEVFAVEKYKDRYEVICRGETWGTEIYTRKLIIERNNLGCKSTINGASLLSVFSLLAVALLYKVCSLKKHKA